jgi:hypothetical protein
MKNKFFACFTGTLLTCTITGIAYTQKLSGIANNAPDSYRDHTPLEYIIPETERLSPSDGHGFLYRNDINIKAVRNFIREYNKCASAEWFKSNNGFAVHFTMDGLNTKVYYDKKGNYEYMIRSYAESHLPPEVRHLVKSRYYDFSIYHVTEITRNGKIVYGVMIEDKTSRKTIRVVDGEMEVVSEYSKS